MGVFSMCQTVESCVVALCPLQLGFQDQLIILFILVERKANNNY